jgi:hypothetical protein
LRAARRTQSLATPVRCVLYAPDKCDKPRKQFSSARDGSVGPRAARHRLGEAHSLRHEPGRRQRAGNARASVPA